MFYKPFSVQILIEIFMSIIQLGCKFSKKTLRVENTQYLSAHLIEYILVSKMYPKKFKELKLQYIQELKCLYFKNLYFNLSYHVSHKICKIFKVKIDCLGNFPKILFIHRFKIFFSF